MILTEEQRKEFEEVVKPVMKFLGNPEVFHPYMKVIIDIGKAEIVARSCLFVTEDYIAD